MSLWITKWTFTCDILISLVEVTATCTGSRGMEEGMRTCAMWRGNNLVPNYFDLFGDDLKRSSSDCFLPTFIYTSHNETFIVSHFFSKFHIVLFCLSVFSSFLFSLRDTFLHIITYKIHNLMTRFVF